MTPLAVVFVILLVILIGLFVYRRASAPAITVPETSTTTTPIVGNDRDVHDCIGSAGYSWCAVKNKCIRPWEETCAATSPATTTAISTCHCPSGYIQEGNVCNPKCYYSTPKCLMASKLCSDTNTSACTPNWTCSWAPCTNGYQGMAATDTNNCGQSSAGVQIACPALARVCTN